MTERDKVVSGLRQDPPALSPKYFYDTPGSDLFVRITEQEEYYPTRVERQILTDHATELAEWLGSGCVLVEPGSGVSDKVRILLDAAPELVAYVPMDIDTATLSEAASQLRRTYPGLEVWPKAGDFTRNDFAIDPYPEAARRVVFHPGSTLGNFPPDAAKAFLKRIAQSLKTGDGLLIGVDLHKDPAVLEAAYDDAAGVTAAFNRNMLTHLNRRFDADFDPDAFEHIALYNQDERRIEMHLEAKSKQTVRFGDDTLTFAAGSRIHTESSYKYEPAGLEALAKDAGYAIEQFFTDARGWFGVWTMRVV